MNILNDNNLLDDNEFNIEELDKNVSDENTPGVNGSEVKESVVDNFDILINSYDKFIEEYKEKQDIYIKCKKIFENEISNSKGNLKKLDLIIQFMRELDEKECKDQLTEELINNLNQLSKKIENNKSIIIAKNNYIKSKKDVDKYLNLVKKLNKTNISNTCPLCLSNVVSVYLNPCGHTCCDKCYEKISTHNDNNCFLCRTNILNKKPLYFS